MPRRATASARPRFASAFWALAASSSPAPTSLNSVARSKTETSRPALWSAIAAVNPPMPPPATPTFEGYFTFTFRSEDIFVPSYGQGYRAGYPSSLPTDTAVPKTYIRVILARPCLSSAGDDGYAQAQSFRRG